MLHRVEDCAQLADGVTVAAIRRHLDLPRQLVNWLADRIGGRDSSQLVERGALVFDVDESGSHSCTMTPEDGLSNGATTRREVVSPVVPRLHRELFC